MRPFDVCGPLPEGTILLEASAGTGKTYTVGALVARYVAEGVARIDQLLVVTFGRAASQELRERVRAQLVEAERAFAHPEEPSGSDVVRHLMAVDDAERAVRHRRLRDALADFDTATIATTHQFCQLVLRSLGVAGDTDAGAALVESLDDLVVEVVDDLYLRRFGQRTTPPPFDRATALRVGRAVVADPQAVIAAAAEGDEAGAERVALAQEVREEIERRKRRLGLLSYDDLLSRLARALDEADAPARARMREQWRVVLVDEFQDTDPVQWQVLDRAFSGHARMVLIGDPKQAIYAFRGGDVVTYLDAAHTAGERATLGTNHRSDDVLVERLQAVLEGAALGDPEIVVRPVEARRRGSRLSGAPRPAPLRLRQVLRDGFKLTRAGLIGAADARAHIARDCAADIAALLAARPEWSGRPLRAGDVAVIVSTRDHGLLVQRALAERGVPAVMAGGGDVFLTAAGDDWLALLEALEAPHRSALVRAAALTAFLGRTAEELDAGGERFTGRLADTLRGWALLVRSRGVAALMEAAEERGLTARVLGCEEGERLLTDLRHLGQLLHERTVRDGLGLTALLEWFREERRRTNATERPRRLDSDAAAVQIVTVHGSKGLEYPITYLPFAYQAFAFPAEVALFHDDAGVRTIDVTGHPVSTARHAAEESGEELRELYVALTRAQSQVVLWWAPTQNTAIGGLHRLLLGRQPGVTEVPAEMAVRDDAYATRVFGLLEQMGGPVAELSEVAEVHDGAEPEELAEPAVRIFDRTVDADWRRTSYSGLIRAEESAQVTSEPEVAGKDDEPEEAEPLPTTESGESGDTDRAESPISPMADLPAGAAFGSLVHAVLEHADPAAPDGIAAELRRRVGEQLRWWPVAADADELAAALVPMQHTPLGPLADGLSLAEIGLGDRLRELEFEFPLVGGDTSDARREGAEIRLRDLAPLLRRHLPADDPLAAYAARLESPVLGDQVLRGYLSGSVDAVLRLPSGRFVVVDYKTNLLGVQGRPVTAADYAPVRLAEAMLHSHYPLQALLYSVVVHRFLRWRIPAYDPAIQLGGVLYLYVRGMCGPETPTTDGVPAGVFSWQPPAELVVALSDLLDGVIA